MTPDSHYFIGIPLPKEHQIWLSQLQEELKEQLSYGVWTHPEDFHITIKFLGGVSPEKVEELKEQLMHIKKLPSFSLDIGHLGFFGDKKKPRVIWSDVQKHKQLIEIQEKVAQVCEGVGFSRENRPFRPHITLAKKWRGQEPLEKNIATLVPNADQVRQMKIDRISLFQIFPNHKPKYHPEQIVRIEKGSK